MTVDKLPICRCISIIMVYTIHTYVLIIMNEVRCSGVYICLMFHYPLLSGESSSPAFSLHVLQRASLYWNYIQFLVSLSKDLEYHHLPNKESCIVKSIMIPLAMLCM
jgi:hypothetical protein